MNQSFFARFRKLLYTGPLLLLLFASAAGVYHLVPDRRRPPGLTELPGLIAARHQSGPMAFSPDGKTIALPKEAGGKVELWSLETGRARVLRSSFNTLSGPADCIAFSADGRLLAVYYRERGVTIWDLPTQIEQTHIPIPLPSWVADMAFATGHRTLVTVLSRGIHQNGWNHSAVSWDVSTGKNLESHVFDPTLLFKALSRDGRYVVLQQFAVGQTVFDLTKGDKAFAVATAGGFRFSEDGSLLVSYQSDQILVWEVPSGREVRRFQLQRGCIPEGYPGYRDHFAVSPNRRVLAIGGFTETQIVGLISLDTGKVLGTLECCPPSMFCDTVCFCPDGRILATNTRPEDKVDREVQPLLRFWKVPAGW